ncbi:DUF2490 domain-containing protein [Flagellimonas flava]|uniref:DUF2490 domain-containing protein n=1 Tax=Flagellimonas flava TaxID=570519 RepID=UPI003D6512C7
MTISSIKWPIGLVLCLLPLLSWGQGEFTGFWQPQMAINYKVSGTYSHNLSLAHRIYFVDEGESGFRGRHLDLVHFSKLELSDNQSIALGIQYRYRDLFEQNPNELRLVQQFNFTQKPLVVRFGHRFRSEQRITKLMTIHRFRYRFAVDFPLKGEKLNLGEPFLVVSLEGLASFAKSSSPEYDARVTSQLGWKFDKGFKLLVGTQYRAENYTAKQPDHILFLLTGVQLSL